MGILCVPQARNEEFKKVPKLLEEDDMIEAKDDDDDDQPKVRKPQKVTYCGCGNVLLLLRL